MNLDKNKRRAMLSWLFVSALFALCGVLGVLQYRWIGEVSVAARERLRGSLQANLDRLSQDFDSEIASACRALLPATPQAGAQAAEAEVAVRYELWKKTSAPRPDLSPPCDCGAAERYGCIARPGSRKRRFQRDGMARELESDQGPAGIKARAGALAGPQPAATAFRRPRTGVPVAPPEDAPARRRPCPVRDAPAGHSLCPVRPERSNVADL